MTDSMEKQTAATLTEEEQREQLCAMLRARAETLGRMPNRKDMKPEELSELRRCFGKWVYALEAAGLRIPSQQSLDRRKAKRKKWDRKHQANKRRSPREHGE